MENNALLQVETLEPTKSNIKRAADILSAAVKDGHINPVEAAIKLKFMQDVFDAAYKEIMPELMNNVKNKTTYLGATLEPAETGTKYDYKSDPKWQELTAAAQPYIDAVKIQEERIKMATKINTSLVDEDTGEVLARPVGMKSTSIVKVTLGK